ncbi:MAG: hypothetical protein M0036_22615 [Desulfobacteraceae bacterium]|nr:hypothetical protein [Desulfobacteraceae bacterium]
MKNPVEILKAKEEIPREEKPQEKHIDVQELNFECDAEDHDFLCALRIAG